nr:right-handed parallel beta-helix repeat-containing protein [Candidatus Sigynarchaeota archaeon]
MDHTRNISIKDNLADYFYVRAVTIFQSSNVTATGNYFARSEGGTYNSGFYLSDATNCTFRNNTFSQVSNGLYQDKGSDTVFENNTVLASIYRGIYLGNVRNVIVRNNTFSSPSVSNVYFYENVTNVEVSHNVITGNRGVRLENGDGWNVTIAHNTIVGTGATSNHGIYINGGHQFNITSNYLYRTGETGIQMLNCRDNVVEKNNITRSTYRGIYFSTNVTNTLVSHNEVGNHTHTTFGFGIWADNSHWNNFTGNYMHDNYKGGLILDESNGNNVWNNTFTRSSGEMLYASAACYLLSASWNDVFNNTFQDNEMCGITLAYGSYYNHIRENMIVDTEFHGIYLSELAQDVGPDHSVIEGNVIANTTSPGIEWDYSGIQVEYVTNVTIVGNRILNCTTNGIYMYETYDSVVQGNLISDHEKSIMMEYCDNVTVYMNAFLNANGSQMAFSSSTSILLDNGSIGNYWDDYRDLHPGAINVLGIWSEPYAIDPFEDRYPLAWDPTAPNEHAPVLSGASVNPLSGSQLTLFTFNVTYTDADNNAPAWIMLVVNGTEIEMEKADPSDIDYTDGCLYSMGVYLQPGTTEYAFDTGDGRFTDATTPDTITVADAGNTNAPVLSFGNVTPASGYLATLFRFSVLYSDADNSAPAWVRVTINGTDFPMFKENPADTNYMDSCVYVYLTNFATAGTYIYTFQASDGTHISEVLGSFPGVVVRPAPTFNDVVDTSDLAFTHGGNATWFQQTVTTHDDVDAVQSGDIYDEEISWFETTIQGPGTIRFYWAVSSEDDYDFLTFYIDDVVIYSISGDVNWVLVEYDVTSTTTVVVRWEYSKDESVDDGQDCGWVDMIEWSYGGALPSVPSAPQNLAAVTGNGSVSLSWSAPA